jgi:uncharacterized protein YdeI (YjbR/CyaY-like superfamily)
LLAITVSKTNPAVDWYFTKDTPWKKEYAKLREIALSCGLTEELKWGNPCYTLDGKNIVLIHGFKEYCAYLFFKGTLMNDPKGILIQQTENVQGPRQIRFSSLAEIKKLEGSLKTYIREAIKIEKAGTKIPLKKTSEFKMTEELEQKFKQMPKLKTAFHKLTPGRQRGYLLYFSSAKQAKTREARIEKYVDQILAGKGVDD